MIGRSTVSTYSARLYMAGDLATAKQTLRQECWAEGLCITIEPTTFIYSGGAEDGICVGFVNYPRFPSEPEAIRDRAEWVARRLMRACAQRTALLVATDETVWLKRELPFETPPAPPLARSADDTSRGQSA